MLTPSPGRPVILKSTHGNKNSSAQVLNLSAQSAGISSQKQSFPDGRSETRRPEIKLFVALHSAVLLSGGSVIVVYIEYIQNSL